MNESIEQSLKIYNDYNSVDWEHISFNRKTGGFVVMHRKHDVGEMGENITIANILSTLGWKIVLLPVCDLPFHYSADAEIHGVSWEFKANKKTTYTAVDNEVRNAAKQADKIVLYFKNDVRKGVLLNALNDRIKRCTNVKNIVIIMNTKIYRTIRKEILNNQLKIE